MSQYTPKQDQITKAEFAALRRTVEEDISQKFKDECRFILLGLGRLGLQPGELAHVSEEWIDVKDKTLRIPEYHQCTHGKDDSVCGSCRETAQEIAESNDNITLDEALEDQWSPQRPERVRTIWYGWSERLVSSIENYLSKHKQYAHSRTSINRRVDRIAETCNKTSKKKITPELLQMHAALFHADNDLRIGPLTEFMGWKSNDNILQYVGQYEYHNLPTEMKKVYDETDMVTVEELIDAIGSISCNNCGANQLQSNYYCSNCGMEIYR